MVRIEITKVILTRGESWALVEYRTTEGRGTLGGNFGCNAATLVPGQVFRGVITTKRIRTGAKKYSFKGIPTNRSEHTLKASLKAAGLSWPDRAALFAAFKPVSGLFAALKNRRNAELMAVQKIGRKKLLRMYKAYDSVATELTMSAELSKALPKLHAYLNENQTAAATAWFDGSMEKFVRFVAADPWRIMYDKEYDSFTYESVKRADFIAATTHASRTKMTEAAILDLGLSPQDKRGKRANAIHILREYMKKSGNYWMPIASFLGGNAEIEATWPCVIHDNHVALVKYADIEAFLGKTFENIKQCPAPHWQPPSPEAILDDTQRQSVIQACEAPLFILQGGAGTGKTTVCKHIVQSLGGKVVCAAPTGKAAQRLAQVTGVAAFTVHRLAYMSAESPLDEVLLLDEQSMQEPEILAMLLKKRTFSKIIFVGDTAQLTSVGPGQFFRDICDSDIPKIELTYIYRSGPTSFIASNGQKIRTGNDNLDHSPDSFVVHPYKNDDDIIENARSVYRETGEMPIVLCNTNAEVSKLNGRLRQICNPIGAKPYSLPVNMDYSNKAWRYADWCFGIGDSVMNTTNKYTEETKELEVANGEIGTVTKVSGHLVTVTFDKVVQYNVREDDFLRPAYALTVNKSQGSEYPVVIVKSSSSWGDKRERFYTAVTRAKVKCIIYEVGTANSDCIRASPARRKTYLLKRN